MKIQQSDFAVPPRYAEWLQHVFDRPVTPTVSFFDLDIEPFDAEPLELAGLIATMLENCGRDLMTYSDEQLGSGLNYVFNNSYSDVVFALMSDNVPIGLRLHAISSLTNLYSAIFEQRCGPVLGHINEPGGNALNSICYMFWDVSPLSYWEQSTDKAVFYEAVCDVLDHALRSPNRACVESGLHGLGHIYPYYPGRVEEIIDAFLARGAARFPELCRYAQAARRGNVQ